MPKIPRSSAPSSAPSRCAALLVCAAFTLPVAVPAAASACAKSMMRRIDPDAELMRLVHRDIHRQRYSRVARRLLKRWPKLRNAPLKATDRKRPRIGLFVRTDHRTRARALLATAVVRSGGKLKAGRRWFARTTSGRAASLTWAVGVLRADVDRSPKNPVALTRLGEALSRTPDGRLEAREILDGLAAKKVITDAWGWAALADLRDASEDPDGRKQALASCRKLARRGALCRRYLRTAGLTSARRPASRANRRTIRVAAR